MKGDFARVSFDPMRHYSQVFQQQGRVLLEADWNEQAQIQLHLLRVMLKDLVGPCWAAGSGFGITTRSTDAKGTVKPLPLTEWLLAPGHFYVDGILCVNDAACTLASQPHAPTPEYGVGDGKSGFENPPAGYALWLDVWERHLCWIEAPAINDAALDGVDTASRAQVVWQLRMFDRTRADQQLDGITAALKLRLQVASTAADTTTLKQQLADVASLRRSIDGQGSANASSSPCTLQRQLLGARATYAWPRLRAQLGPVDSDSDPCVIAADARYRGCENQLYRIEIHQGGLAGSANATTATSFKWSRENGSVVFPLLGSVAGAVVADGSTPLTVSLASLGRDARLGLAVNDWVELVDDDDTLAQRAFPLLQVIAVNISDRSVTLNVPKNVLAHLPANDPSRHPLLRRWDQHAMVNVEGVLEVSEGEWITLEDGVQIFFEPGGVYATGDYWLAAARVAGNGMLDWPQLAGAAAAVRSHGMHHYAVLGVVDDKNGYDECCCRFDSLCSLLQTDASSGRNIIANPLLQPRTPVTKAAAATTPGKAATKKVRSVKPVKASGRD